MIRDLRSVAESRAIELTRTLARLDFTQLEPWEVHDLMSLQPVDTRTAADWEQLARLAVAALKIEVALQHARESLKTPDATERTYDRVVLLVELLLRLGRQEEAVGVTRGWTGRPERQHAEAIRLANLLATYGRRSDAAALLARAAQNKAIPPGDRYAIMLRQAELELRPTAAADLCWQVGEAGLLPPEKLLWACHQMNQAKQAERVVMLLERRLRSGVDLPPKVLAELQAAYLAEQRTRDARRACEQDPPPPTSPPAARQRNTFDPRFGGGMF
jgi:hypothetical protein